MSDYDDLLSRQPAHAVLAPYASDSWMDDAAKAIVSLRRELAAARALLKQYRTTLRSVFFCDHNEREWPSLGVCQEWARKECERIDAALLEGEAK